MSIDETTLDKAWDTWAAIWDPKERQKGAYMFALKDLTNDQFREAARIAPTECRFFPTPYDIKRLAPPPKSAFQQGSKVPAGWRSFDGMEPDGFKRHSRRCESWFNALQSACDTGELVDPNSGETIADGLTAQEGFIAVAKKLVAIQHILTKEGENLRASFEYDPDEDATGTQGVLDMDGGKVGPVRKEEVRSVGVRRDRDEPLSPAHPGADNVSRDGKHEAQKDDVSDAPVVLAETGGKGGNTRVGLQEKKVAHHGETCVCPACEAKANYDGGF